MRHMTVEEEKLIQSFTEPQMEIYTNWSNRLKLVLHEQSEDQWLDNCVLILGSLRSVGYDFSTDNLTRVFQRLMQNGKTIYKAPEAPVTNPRSHAGKTFSE